MTRPVTPGQVAEHLDLVQGILPGSRVENEDDVMRGLGVQPAKDTANLG
jgi:hypothetical protein